MADDNTVWLLSSSGIPWHVEVGSAAHEKLVLEDAQVCDENGNVLEQPAEEVLDLDLSKEPSEDDAEDEPESDDAEDSEDDSKEPADDESEEEVLT